MHNTDHRLELDRAWYFHEYGDVKAKAVLRELQHYNLHGRLPDDAVFIERVEWVNGGAIIIHRDPNEVKQ